MARANTAAVWALQWSESMTGQTSLCEVEQGVVYHVGSQLAMRLAACQGNNQARANGWPSRYRAVPLPFTDAMPEYAVAS